jgi:hypothetical protein
VPEQMFENLTDKAIIATLLMVRLVGDHAADGFSLYLFFDFFILLLGFKYPARRRDM